MRIRALALAVSGLCLLLAVAPRRAAAQARPVYANDFSRGAAGGLTGAGVSATWSTTATDTTPSGRYGRFLGRFTNDTVSLSLNGLPRHRQIAVVFRLFVIQSWDGNSQNFGPDFWEFGVTGGPRLLYTTFSNNHPDTGAAGQSYPDQYFSSFRPHAGASEVDTLGYDFGEPMDSVYVIARGFFHSGSSVQIYFRGSNLQDIGDESWGIDNILVTAIP